MPARPRGPSLPDNLLRQLGAEEPRPSRARKLDGPGRKERRTAQRSKRRPEHNTSVRQNRPVGGAGGSSSRKRKRQHPAATIAESGKVEEDAEVKEDEEDEFDGFDTSDDEGSILHRPSPPQVPGTARRVLDREDAEIAALERKLGLKGRKTLPREFHEDGLGDLLQGLNDGGSDNESRTGRRRDAETDEWLARKRRKAVSAELAEPQEDEGDAGLYGNDEGGNGSDASREWPEFSAGDDDSSLDDMDDSSDSGRETTRPPVPRQRENPYVAPTTESAAKYVPPARRKPAASDEELVGRLRRQIQGLVNRLTESNLLAILGDIETLYQKHPRHHLTAILGDLLLERVSVASSLPDTFLILDAAFTTAVYRVVGTDFGAYMVQHVVSQLREHYDKVGATYSGQRQPVNLMALLTQLYNFNMVGSNLIFDFIRLFLRNLSELDTELLLRTIRISGPQLRQDDPLALRDIVTLVRTAVPRAGGQGLSARVRFMVDAINDLKNNKMKAGAAVSAVNTEHSTRMKKILGSLNTRKLQSTEPLRVGLNDIEQSDARGKWWLVGASWAGASSDGAKVAVQTRQPTVEDDDQILGSWADDVPDMSELERLAKQQGMNTEIRRAVFVSLLSAASYQDAYARLLKLRLGKHDKREIANVLIQCTGSEDGYNPYYALVGGEACSDRKVQWAFQDCLWKLFRRIGESIFGEGDEEDQDDETMNLRRLANIGRMYGSLVASGSIGLNVLKCLNMAYLRPKTRAFVEVLLITLFEECQLRGGSGAIRKVFTPVRGEVELARGMRYFLRKVVRRSTLVAKTEAAKIGRACEVAANVLGQPT